MIMLVAGLWMIGMSVHGDARLVLGIILMVVGTIMTIINNIHRSTRS